MKNKVKQIVEEHCVSVYDFWQRTGMSKNTAYLLHNNPHQYPRSDVMAMILKAFDLTPNDVIELDTET